MGEIARFEVRTPDPSGAKLRFDSITFDGPETAYVKVDARRSAGGRKLEAQGPRPAHGGRVDQPKYPTRPSVLHEHIRFRPVARSVRPRQPQPFRENVTAAGTRRLRPRPRDPVQITK